MNWGLWMRGLKGPELVLLVDRGETTPIMSEYERTHAMGPPIKLAPAEQWLPIVSLQRLYPAPKPAADDAPKPTKPPEA